MTVIVCYAPTEDAEEEIKHEFYDQLEKAIRNTSQHYLLLVTDDLKARVGMDNTGKERTMGTHGYGYINNNCERHVELCEETNLGIGGYTQS